MAYRPRIVDQELEALLDATGCVVIEGAKAVGKTETARQTATSEVLLDVDANARRLADADPGLLLDGDTPRLVDEWQLAPQLWNHVRREVDRRGHPGQFILTGSAVPADDITRHSGAGRMARLRMRPMSLFESGHSSAEVSLTALFDGSAARAADTGATVSSMLDRLCIGGWPQFTSLEPGAAQRALRSYLDEISRADIHRVDGVRRAPLRTHRVLRSLARHTATPATARTVATDAGGADGPLDNETLAGYLTALERLMIIEDVPAWSPALRSRARLRVAATRHFVDPCLAVAALRGSSSKLLADINFAGLLFESMVIRDLRVYLQRFRGTVYHYRDSNGLEADAVLELDDGRWAAVEVKLGSRHVDTAATNLLKLARTVDPAHAAEPAFLAVITATGYAYTRKDGVHVVPIGTLGP